MKTKIEKLYDDVCHYNSLTLKNNVENRLNKVLLRYIEELDSASERVLSKKVTTVYKELSRYEN